MAGGDRPSRDARDASVYYDPYQGRAVLALLPLAESVPRPPSTLTVADWGTSRRVLANPASGPDLEAVRSALGGVIRGFGSALLLHPHDRASVPVVLDNWLAALEDETPPTGPHSEYIGLEVADSPLLSLGFLRPEIMLWESLAELTESPAARACLEALQEGLEIATTLTAQLESHVRDGRRSSALAVNTLCDLARRALVSEKRLALEELRSATALGRE